MSTVPDVTRQQVERALTERLDEPTRVVRTERVGGGCISPTARIETGAGDAFFLKWAEAGAGHEGLLAAEAEGLAALHESGAVRVPAVVARSEADAAGAWLLLEWLEPGRATGSTWEALGRSLAELHGNHSNCFGWDGDNFIGSLPQRNGRVDDWAHFWRERRLEPQLSLARDAGYFQGAESERFRRLLDALDTLLADADTAGPSLLHGDLWNGNVHILADGTPALIDPSAYYGHGEVDLAMSELFGGFGAAFYRAYDEVRPIPPAYRERRRAIYQLYYLLVHVNLFGAGYTGSTLRTLGEAGF